MTFLVKIMLNALYGSMLVNKERFRNIKLITTEKEANRYIKLNNIHSFVEINKNLNISLSLNILIGHVTISLKK